MATAVKELYGIWCEVQLVVKSPKRGRGPTMREHQTNLQKTHQEVVQFLDSNNLGAPLELNGMEAMLAMLHGAGKIPRHEGLPHQHTPSGVGDPGGSHQIHTGARDHEGYLR